MLARRGQSLITDRLGISQWMVSNGFVHHSSFWGFITSSFVTSLSIVITLLLLLLLVVVFLLLQLLHCFYLNLCVVPGSELILLHIPLSRWQGSEQIVCMVCSCWLRINHDTLAVYLNLKRGKYFLYLSHLRGEPLSSSASH